MKLSQFKFKLPEEQVALEPSYHRDECRLMVVHRKSGKIEMTKKDDEGNDLTDEEGNPVYLEFRNILDYFDEDDTFIFNDTKVFPARLYGTKEKTDAKIEVFLLRELNPDLRLWDVLVEPARLLRELNPDLRLWDVLVEPARKIRIGNKLFFEDDGPMVAEVIDNTTSRGRTLRFLYDCPHDEFKRELFGLGEAPLPRYIVDKREATEDDMDRFQTIYAKNEGAVTAPASGLHFSRELLKRMEIRGINFSYITLHCGLGCFDPIEVEDLTKHKMSSEQMFVSKEACEIVNKTKMEGHRVCAVGVSTARATESAVGTDGYLKEFEGWTNKFIFPPYEFGLSNALVANFYHPESTMMMIQCAFGGYDLVYEGYKKALKNGYKFGCYGDAMLILDD